ncbi:copper resistance protein CopC [Mesorhizobium sp. M0815]
MKRAHARLVEATPEINSTIAAPPTEIRLRFSRKRLAG